MSDDLQLFVIAYDIVDDRRRARVSALLEQSATRVQLSLFEAMVTAQDAAKLTQKVIHMLAAGDKLRAYPLPSRMTDEIVSFGGPPIENNDGYWLL
jgi:CRISPR-associated endonuclease Cas2